MEAQALADRLVRSLDSAVRIPLHQSTPMVLDLSARSTESHYFFLGDNLDSSNDSRFRGLASRSNNIGEVVYVWKH